MVERQHAIETEENLARRLDALNAQIAAIRSELEASTTHRRLMAHALRTVGDQLKALSQSAAGDDGAQAGRSPDRDAASPGPAGFGPH